MPFRTIAGRFARQVTVRLALDEGGTDRTPVDEARALSFTSRSLASADDLDCRDAEQ